MSSEPIYVYAEHTARAGDVVVWDPYTTCEEWVLEEKGDDIFKYADSEVEAVETARKVLARPQRGPSYDHKAARKVLEYAGETT